MTSKFATAIVIIAAAAFGIGTFVNQPHSLLVRFGVWTLAAVVVLYLGSVEWRPRRH